MDSQITVKSLEYSNPSHFACCNPRITGRFWAFRSLVNLPTGCAKPQMCSARLSISLQGVE